MPSEAGAPPHVADSIAGAPSAAAALELAEKSGLPLAEFVALRARETAKKVLGDVTGQVRVAAIRALTQVALESHRERTAIYALKPLLYDSEPVVQDAAETALVELY